MFLAGLKFALGLVVGLVLMAGVATLGMIAAESLERWRKKRRRLQRETEARVRTTSQIREHVVLHFHPDDWERGRRLIESLRGKQ